MEHCQRKGCSGTIVDGACDACGRPPAGKSLLAPTSAAPPSPPVSTATSASTATSSSSSSFASSRSSSSRSSRSHRTGTHGSQARLGVGLVTVTPLVSEDPLQRLMKDPVVPDNKRHCGGCDAALNHQKGFCPMCGREYSFEATLVAGQVLAGQYEVKGPLAFGGLGWIYLAWDATLSRWVVLKGLLNSKDEVSAAAALQERRFLAAVKHANVVGVYNFVNHGTEGYIVMEYVGGKTLKEIRKERGPLPAAEAIAYVHRILSAFAYLHRKGIIYCDFKPDNFMLEEDDVKLIDMGGVRRVDDQVTDVFGTKGYSAPEAGQEPSVAGDLYTVARTLAVLLMDFPFQKKYLHSLPPAAEAPVLKAHPPLQRFLLKATRTDPEQRFQSAEEMAGQLIGVLRQVVAAEGVVKPGESGLFLGDGLDADGLEGELAALKPGADQVPRLKLDLEDPAAKAVSAVLPLDPARRVTQLRAIVQKHPDSLEAHLNLAAALLDAGKPAEAEPVLAKVNQLDPYDWRPAWHRGRMSLLTSAHAEARKHFDWVHEELPGELAPQLALALALELTGDAARAVEYHDRVSSTDPSYVSASLGLGRCLLVKGDRAAAAAALRRVPESSSVYHRAQVELVRAMLEDRPAPPSSAEIAEAGTGVQLLLEARDGLAVHRLAAEMLLTAIGRLEAGDPLGGPGKQLLGQPLEVQTLRFRAEEELRACARFAATPEERVTYVDLANQVRPRTLF